jgi:hypothetical protein
MGMKTNAHEDERVEHAAAHNAIAASPVRLEQKQLAVLQGATALGADGVSEVRLSNLGPADSERRDPVGIGDPELGLPDCTIANVARVTTTDFPAPPPQR